MPGDALMAVAAVAVAAVVAAVVGIPVLLAWRGRKALGVERRRVRRRPHQGAHWATPADLLALREAPKRSDEGSRRLVLGRLLPGAPGTRRRPRQLVATEASHSLLVLGPTQSGKTTGLAIPAILEWEGPVVATSVKDDLAALTAGWRSRQGSCFVFDPTASSGLGPSARWSPLCEAGDWGSAQRMAGWLVETAPARAGLSEAAFWFAAAAKLLAPLMLAASRAGLTMAEVVRWTDTGDTDEAVSILDTVGEDRAAIALLACAARDERIRSSVSTTLETVLSPFADPVVAASTAGAEIDPYRLLGGYNTLYLCGPSHEQFRVQGLFAALVSSVVAAAMVLAARHGGRLDPPLLLVLDEMANIAPIRDLDTLASTAAGLGMQLVTVCQDLAQVAARYGPERSRTIANNHRAKLLLSGVSDLGTLDLVSGLAGEAVVREETVTADLRDGRRTRTTASTFRRLAPVDLLRAVVPGEGVLVYGHLPPARLALRPWYRDKGLRARVGYSRAE